MKLAIDIDETIADFYGGLMNFYHKKTGKLHKKEEFTEYDVMPVWKVSLSEAEKLLNEFHKVHNHKEVKPFDYSVDTINSLINQGISITIITARPKEFQEKTKEWFNHYFSDINFNIIHTQGRKYEECKKLGINVILEDSKSTALDCAKEGIKVILFDKPWNQKIEHENIFRVKNWKEVSVNLKKITASLT